MTKLRLLNAYLTERLMVAVREILEVVEGTVSEYQEEAARTQRENENLRRRLREVGLDSEPDWSGSAHPLSLSASEGRSPIEQRCEQDWSSSFREDHELAGNEEEQELCENQRPKQACDPAVLVSAGLHLPAYDPTGSLSTARFVKSDHEEGSLQPPDLFKIQIVSTEGAYSPPGVMADAIKMEPSEVYCGVSEKLAGPLSLDPVNPECNSKDGVGSNRAGGGPLSLPEVEQPRGRSKKINGKRSHNCPQCGKAFSHVSRLKIHLRIHTGEKPFRCSQCGKCFNNDGTLKNHQRVHTEVRLYSCKECGMSFKDAYTCKKHQRVHTGEKPYCCTHCGKHFNEVGNLQTHIRTHTGERPYCCTLCGKRFAESGKLKKHFRIHTRGNTQS